MNTIIMNIDDNSELNLIYNQLKKLYPKIEIIKNDTAPDNLKARNHEKFMKAMEDLNGSKLD